MQTSQWIELINRIPREDHDTLLVGTSNGVEIAVQNILRIENEYLLIRGRLSGTTEMGQIFILPYDRMTYVNFTRPMHDDKLTKIFGALLVAEKRPPTLEEQPAEDAPAEAAAEPVKPVEADVVEEAKPQSTNPLRDRLRARLAQVGGGQNPPKVPAR
jgi:hypothetical protein